MKSKRLEWVLPVITVFLFAVLTTPVQLAVQEQAKLHHHYKLIDISTFGGPSIYLNAFVDGFVPRANGPFFSGAQLVTGERVLAGWADTSQSDSVPNFCFNPDCFVSHAFEWHDGILSDLGTLADGWSSAATWVNESGEIVGLSENGLIDPLIGFPEIRAVRWSHGRILDLGTLGGNQSAALAVNNRGQIAGLALNTIPDPFSIYDLLNYGSPSGTQTRAVLWDKNGRIEDLGTLGGPDAYAQFVNEHGQVTGWSYTNSTPNATTKLPTFHPFLWEKEKGMQDLGTLGGTVAQAVNGINERGEVVGATTLAGDSTHHPFLWDGKKLIDLGTLGGDSGEADWINERGEVVGIAQYTVPCPNGLGGAHAFLWRNGVMTDLGSEDTVTNSEAVFINSSTQIVGYSFSCDLSVVDALLWEGGSGVNLNVLISQPSAFHLFFTAFINDRGEIGAFGSLPNGDTHAVLLVPCDENHPGIDGCDYDPVDPNVLTDTSRRATWNANAIISGELRAQFLGQLGLAKFLRNRRQAVLSSPAVVLSPTATLSPTSLTFSVQALGTTSPAKIVTMKNAGTASLTIASIAITGSSAGDFAQTHTCAGSLAVGTSCSISVTFKPMVSGTRTAALSITDNASGSPQQVPLNGTGTTAKLSPESLNFGTVAIGTTSRVESVMLTNVASTTLTITGITITGTNAADFLQTHTCGSSLAAGAGCSISVTFKPTASGTRTAALSVSDNAAGSPQKVSLSGTGTTAKLFPSGLIYFGSVQIGKTSTRTVTLTNVGTTTLTITAITITGDAADFLQTHTCGSSLAAGASCSISVTFKPTQSGTGIRNATLSVADNASGSPQTVPLAGGCIPFGGFCYGPGPNMCCPAPRGHHSFCSDPTGPGTCIED